MVEILWGEHAEGIDNRQRRVRTHLGALMRSSSGFCLKSRIQSDFIIGLRGGNCPISYSRCGIGIVFKVDVGALWLLGHVRPLSWSISATFSILSIPYLMAGSTVSTVFYEESWFGRHIWLSRSFLCRSTNSLSRKIQLSTMTCCEIVLSCHPMADALSLWCVGVNSAIAPPCLWIDDSTGGLCPSPGWPQTPNWQIWSQQMMVLRMIQLS